MLKISISGVVSTVAVIIAGFLIGFVIAHYASESRVFVAQSEDIMFVQRRLSGYGAGAADGTMRPKTREAIRTYQRDWQLPETGEINRDLIARLKGEHPATRAQWLLTEDGSCEVWNNEPQAQEVVTWAGECPSGRADGTGVMSYSFVRNGLTEMSSYEGMIKNGRPHGRGVQRFPDVGQIEGEWKDGTLSGRVVFAWVNGNRYEGNWENSPQGDGVMVWAYGDRYDGEWRDGKRTGQGVMAWANGDRYEGEWRANKRHGHGVFVAANGYRYEGQWRDDVPFPQGNSTDFGFAGREKTLTVQPNGASPSASSRQPIHQSAFSGNAETVGRLIRSDPQLVDARDAEGLTPLHIAASEGQVEVVRLLLANGADPNATTHRGQTPLHEAPGPLESDKAKVLGQWSKAGFTGDVFAELYQLAKNGDWSQLEKPDVRFDQVPRLLADVTLPPDLARRKVAVVRLLIEAGADVNRADRDGFSPLHSATPKGAAPIAQALLEAGADVNMKSGFGIAPLHMAAINGAEQVVRVLIDSGATIDEVDNVGATPLSDAISFRLPRMVEVLLEHGANPDHRNQNGWTELARAAAANLIDIADLLLAHGANVETRDNAGFTPLHTAAEKGHTELVKLLLKHGADPNTDNDRRRTALDTAAAFGRAEIAKILLDQGIDPNSADDTGSVALHAATSAFRMNMVELLLEHGAEFDRRDNIGRTPIRALIDSVVHLSRPDSLTKINGVEIYQDSTEEELAQIVESLVKAGADIDAADAEGQTPLHQAAANGSVVATRILISNGASVSARNPSGNTPLHKAALNSGSTEVASILLEHGADIEARNAPGQTAESTPLLAAATAKNVELAKFLIERGANVHAMASTGATALHLAAWRGDLELIKALQAAGADFDARDAAGYTPFMVAERFGQDSAAQLLRRAKPSQ